MFIFISFSTFKRYAVKPGRRTWGTITVSSVGSKTDNIHFRINRHFMNIHCINYHMLLQMKFEENLNSSIH